MAHINQFTVGSLSKHIAITVPASGGTAVTIMSLLAPLLESQYLPLIIGGRLNASATSYTLGDSTVSLPVTVPTNTNYEEPVLTWLRNTYIKSTGASFSLTVTVYLAQPL